MNYPVSTSIQLRAVLRAMRRRRGFSQEQAGRLLGVNQKRLAAIEKTPGVTGFGQISRLVTALGGRLVVELREEQPKTETLPAGKGGGEKSGAAAKQSKTAGNW